MNIIPSSGPIGANLMIIGEAPGEEEVRFNQPFMGDSGKILRHALTENGMNPEECFMTNVINVHPPHNNLKLLAIPIQSFLPRLFDEIKKVNPNCILLVGGTALRYIANLDKITNYRGSILSVLDKKKAVPCIHPADFIRSGNWKEETIFRCFDVKRAIEESRNPVLNLPKRYIHILDNSMQVVRYLEQVKDKLSIDIETHLSLPVCIGLSYNINEGISIPLIELRKKPSRDLCQTWKELIEFFGDMEGKIKIVGQNIKFDQYICNKVGLRFPDPYSDTMLKSHTCYPELPKGLAFLTSIWTREPYYKDEGKEFNIKKHGLNRLLLYNAKDAVVTLEVDQSLEEDLVEFGLVDFYYNYIMKKHKFYYDIESTGFLIDEKVRLELQYKYLNMYKDLDKSNRLILGLSFNPNSPKQCEDIIYGRLKCPRRQNTKEDTMNQMIGNKVVKDSNAITVIKNMLEMRKIRKTLSTYLCARTEYINWKE